MTNATFPLEASLRQTAVMVGDGITTVFGPFVFKIFDIADVIVMRRDAGEDAFSIDATVTISKTSTAAWATFTLTFAVAPPATTSFYADGARLQTRSLAVTKGTGLDTDALDKELTKIGVVQQEQTRKLNSAALAERGVTPPTFREAITSGSFVIGGPDGTLVNGPNGLEVADVEALAAIADDISTVAGVAASIPTVAGMSDDIALLASVSAVLDGTASAVRMDEKMFTGDAVTTDWVLDRAPGIAENVLVWIGGSIQDLSDYSVVGTTLTIAPAVAAGVPIRTLIMTLVTSNYIEGLAAAALASEVAAALSAAGVNLPAISIADAKQALTVKADGSGYETSPVIITSETASQLLAGPLQMPYIQFNNPDILWVDRFVQQQGDARLGVIEAVKALYNSDSNPSTLDGMGVEYIVDAPILLDNTVLTFGAGYKRNRKYIKNLNLKADTGGTWSSGDGVFAIGGDQVTGNLRNLSIQDSRSDASNITGVVPWKVFGYYNLEFIRSHAIQFTDAGFFSFGGGDTSGNHGLVLDDCRAHGTFGSGGSTIGLLTQDGDVIVRNTFFEWLATGIKTTRGSIHMVGNHFSLADETNFKNALLCVCTRGISVIDNDFDGSMLTFTNTETNDFDGTNFHNWYDILISNNDFTSGTVTPPSGRGFINFITQVADESVVGLVIADNRPQANASTPWVRFNTQGSGTWLTTFESSYDLPNRNNISAGNFPGIQSIARNQNASAVFNASGYMEIEKGTGGRIVLRDSVNAGSNMPGVQSSGSNLDLLASGAAYSASLQGAGGAFTPGTDNTQHLGGPSFRWATVYAGTGSINTSDEALKTDVRGLTEAERRAFRECAQSVKAFRWIDAKEKKGGEARWHIGLIAQQVAAIFESHGLDPWAYGMFCRDQLVETIETGRKDNDEPILEERAVVDADGNSVFRHGIRYDAFFAGAISALVQTL